MKKIFSIILMALTISVTPSFTSCNEDIANNLVTDDADAPIDTLHPTDGNDLYGLLTDTNGKGVQGVVVTDGYKCTITDATGFYQMRRDTAAKFVSYSIPAIYKANSSKFYKVLSTDTKRYDFTLEKNSTDENHFYLLVMADPQVRSKTSFSRFQNETMSYIRTFISQSNLPVVGLSMGDDVHEGHSEFEARMEAMMNGTTMPVFSAVGNHDYFIQNGDSTKPRSCAAYEKAFGPTNYSFNKGNVHFIALNNVSYSDGINYKGAFSDAQMAWMKQDLSYIPKNMMIVVYYHIPIRDDEGFTNRETMLNLLADYPNKILMCGHTHYMRNYVTKAPIQIEERIHAAVCGAFWNSSINGDGTPNGYSVYEFKGNSIINNWYRSVEEPQDYQIRLLHGNDKFGGIYGSYTYGLTSNYIVANVWNWDYTWKVYCYEDGILSGEMTNSLEYFKTDAWAQGYHIGVLQRAKTEFSPYTMHDFIYQLKNPNAKVKVVAVDRYGNTYSQDVFTTDFSEAMGANN
jgi:hypothetical protein